MRSHRTVSAESLAEGAGVAVEIDGRPIVLFRSEGTIRALDNLCPHAGSRLERGRVSDGAVVCPVHGARFDLADGHCRNQRIGGDRPIVTHAVRIVDGVVEVTLAAEPMTMPS